MTDHITADLVAGGDAQVIADLAEAAAEPTTLVPDRLYAYVVPDGHRIEHVHTESFQPHPDRANDDAGYVTTTSDFVQVVKRHASITTTLWACPDEGNVIAIFNDHAPGQKGSATEQPGWRDWRITFSPNRSQAWMEWVGIHRKDLTQTQFAEFIEDHLPDIVTPDGADLLEMAQTFQASTKVEFKSSRRLATGANEISYSEEIDATAGRNGAMQVPSEITIAVPIYDNADHDADAVPVRLRYRVRDGRLTIVLVLDRHRERQRDAFDALVAEVAKGSGIPVWTGRP